MSVMKVCYYWIGFSFTKESRPKLYIPSIDSKKYALRLKSTVFSVFNADPKGQ